MLAWALLLHRGSSGSESGDQEAGFTYGFCQPANGHSSPMLEVVALPSDVISGDNDHISKALEAVRAIRQKGPFPNGKPVSVDGQSMFFATADPASKHASKVRCPIDIASGRQLSYMCSVPCA